MQYEFTKASQHGVLLRNNQFMNAMSRIGSSVAAFIFDSPSTRGAVFDSYVAENNISARQMALVDSMAAQSTYIPSAGEDTYAVAQMMRLQMKEINLSAALNSAAIGADELSTLDIQSGIVTVQSVKALQEMGMPALAKVAEFYVK